MRSKVSIGWVIVVSVLVGTVVAPIGVHAAGQLVEINNSKGRVAEVSRANQLYTAESAPDQYFNVAQLGVGTTCRKIAEPPAGKALVVKIARYNVFQVSPGPGQWVASFVGTDCDFGGLVDLVNPPGVGHVDSTFGPGLAIPNGKALWARTATSSVAAELYVSGYLVPSAAVPSTPPLSSSAEAGAGPGPNAAP